MTTASATLSPATVTPTTNVGTNKYSSHKRTKLNYISGLNSFRGLKANNSVISLGFPVCTQQSFAKIISSLKTTSQGKGGALSSTCNAAVEIFRIASIIPALVLVGVVVGFVLL
ncbi:uncharacterized protein [Nicotiana sylvestris]|uniref:Uncharacterized protein LOC104220953 n=1 Tax=Nicotiana sylvestris TaxID=4096 RepID=A0A1U7VQP7_NICSY|nr:PREDICTED: uncharacterized protein LOC104220953 [Nicotiana sylvestris]